MTFDEWWRVAGKLDETGKDDWRECWNAALMAAGAQAVAKNAEISALLDRVALLRSYLVRYRKEVPLGHQPHMLAHLVDDVLGRA